MGMSLKGHNYPGSHIPSTHKSTPPPCGGLWVMLTGDTAIWRVYVAQRKQTYLVGCYHLGILQMTYVDCPTMKWYLR